MKALALRARARVVVAAVAIGAATLPIGAQNSAPGDIQSVVSAAFAKY